MAAADRRSGATQSGTSALPVRQSAYCTCLSSHCSYSDSGHATRALDSAPGCGVPDLGDGDQSPIWLFGAEPVDGLAKRVAHNPSPPSQSSQLERDFPRATLAVERQRAGRDTPYLHDEVVA